MSELLGDFDKKAKRFVEKHAAMIVRLQFMPTLFHIVVESGKKAAEQKQLSKQERKDFAATELLKNLDLAKKGSPWAGEIIDEIKALYA